MNLSVFRSFSRSLMSAVALIGLSFATASAQDQSERPKLRVYGEVTYGAGFHLFNGRLEDARQARVDSGFTDNRFGNAFAAGFFVVPARTPNFGFGMSMKGTFGAPAERDRDDAQFFFNGYSVNVAAKWFPFEDRFNKGWLLRGQIGFGQFLQKLRQPKLNRYEHQYAIGSSALLGIGYALPVGKSDRAILIETQLEYNSRNGDQTGVGEKINFTYGQVSLNIGYSF